MAHTLITNNIVVLPARLPATSGHGKHTVSSGVGAATYVATHTPESHQHTSKDNLILVKAGVINGTARAAQNLHPTPQQASVKTTTTTTRNVALSAGQKRRRRATQLGSVADNKAAADDTVPRDAHNELADNGNAEPQQEDDVAQQQQQQQDGLPAPQAQVASTGTATASQHAPRSLSAEQLQLQQQQLQQQQVASTINQQLQAFALAQEQSRQASKLNADMCRNFSIGSQHEFGGAFTSPNYPNPYPENLVCTRLIEGKSRRERR